MSVPQPAIDAPSHPAGRVNGQARRARAAHRAGPPRRAPDLWRWWPAVVVWGFAAVCLWTSNGIGIDTTGVFTGYVIGMIVLPGTLLWRAFRLTGRGARSLDRRPLAEDVALGTVLGYVCELPVYVLARYLDHPMAVLAWPAVVVLSTVLTKAGRRVWTRDPNGGVVPSWWATAMTAMLVTALLVITRYFWGAAPGDSIATLSRPYVDDPYHLALIGDLRHHFPAQIPYVAGTPMYYHWLVYVHVASASWVTGLEPTLLYKSLTMPTVAMAGVVATSMVAARLSGRWWAGLVPAAGLTVMSPPALFKTWLSVPLSTPYSQGFGSPTQTFATMVASLTLLVFIELLRGTVRTTRWWILAAALFVALAGSKSAFPPVVLAGLALTAVLALLGRRLDRPAWGLLAVGVAGFFVAQRIFYGTGSRSLIYSPLHALVRMVQDRPGLNTDGFVPYGVRAVLAVWFTSVVAVWVAGSVGFLPRGGRRDPAGRFLLGVCLAAWSLMMLLGHPNMSEYYLLQSGMAPALLLSALGLARLSPVVGDPQTSSRVTVGRAAAVVLLTAALFSRVLAPALTSTRASEEGRTPAMEAVVRVLVPLLEFWGVVAVTLILLTVVLRRVGFTRDARWLLSGLLLLGLALDPPTKVLDVTRPIGSPQAGHVVLPTGAVQAARFLRDHSSPDDLVATNAHCTMGPRKGCTHRSFWVSAYTERRVLVEGWAYIPLDTVGLKADNLTTDIPTFWDPKKLAANENAFYHPTPANLRALRSRYGATWLLVDLRYPNVNTTALKAHADLRFEQGQTAVYRLR